MEQLECTNCHVRSFTASAWACVDYPCDDCGRDAHLVVDPATGEPVPAKDDEPLEEVALRG